MNDDDCFGGDIEVLSQQQQSNDNQDDGPPRPRPHPQSSSTITVPPPRQQRAEIRGDDDAQDDDDAVVTVPEEAPLEVASSTAAPDAHAPAEVDAADAPIPPEARQKLTRREGLNLLFSVLAWACTICTLTLVVGTSNVVVLSIGAPTSLSAVPLGAFFVGASFVSLTVTPWVFGGSWGRKPGFLSGTLLGLTGSGLAAIALVYSLPSVFVLASVFFGAAVGIGFFLRFAVVELVPAPTWSARAVTLVVSGGCLAAFAGPESAAGTKGAFGDDDNMLYMGVVVMAAVFNVLNAVFIALVRFPPPLIPSTSTTEMTTKATKAEVLSLIRTRAFLVPMLLAAATWAIMALPMSLLRVAMMQLGYSSRNGVLAIELHFLGMYAPGFVTGALISRYGPRKIAAAAAVFFAVALVPLLAIVPRNPDDGGAGTLAAWIVGMIVIGIGWNCGFSSSTVWSTRCYAMCPECGPRIQAANDSMMFLLAGILIFSASYIYEAGGGGLAGWRVLLLVVTGLLAVFVAILSADTVMERRRRNTGRNTALGCQNEDKTHNLSGGDLEKGDDLSVG